MSFKKPAVVVLAAALAGCAGLPTTYGSGNGQGRQVVDYVPRQVEPQSCQSLRRFDDQLAQQRARGNSQITNAIIGSVIGAVTGNESSRDAGIGALGGAVAAEVYTTSQQRTARNQLFQQCQSDLRALQQPGGVCYWDARTNETTRVVNGRPVASYEGDARRTINCQGTGGTVGATHDPG